MRKSVSEMRHAAIEEKRMQVKQKVSELEPYALGYAFLWGDVEIMLKNGKSKKYRVCIGSVCCADHDEACRLAESVPGVSNVTYNLD